MRNLLIAAAALGLTMTVTGTSAQTTGLSDARLPPPVFGEHWQYLGQIPGGGDVFMDTNVVGLTPYMLEEPPPSDGIKSVSTYYEVRWQTPQNSSKGQFWADEGIAEADCTANKLNAERGPEWFYDQSGRRMIFEKSQEVHYPRTWIAATDGTLGALLLAKLCERRQEYIVGLPRK